MARFRVCMKWRAADPHPRACGAGQAGGPTATSLCFVGAAAQATKSHAYADLLVDLAASVQASCAASSSEPCSDGRALAERPAQVPLCFDHDT